MAGGRDMGGTPMPRSGGCFVDGTRRTWPREGRSLRRGVADEHFGGDAQAFVEAADHGEGEGPFAVENFGDAGAAAEVLFEVGAAEAALFHGEMDGGHGVGRVDAGLRRTLAARTAPAKRFGAGALWPSRLAGLVG